MKKEYIWSVIIISIAFIAFPIIFLCPVNDMDINRIEDTLVQQPENEHLPAGIRKLINAYPVHIVSLGPNSIIWSDGTEMTYDDGIQNKSYQELLHNPDLEDQV